MMCYYLNVQFQGQRVKVMENYFKLKTTLIVYLWSFQAEG